MAKPRTPIQAAGDGISIAEVDAFEFRPITTFSPFRHPTFCAMWGANLVAQMGIMIQSVGASWLMASITSSADLVALIQTSVALPIVLLSMVSGTIADLYDERRIMIAAQSMALAGSAAIGVLAYTGGMTPYLLIALTFLLGCCVTLNSPSWQASVRDLVPSRELGAAISLNSVALHICRSVGPAIGGVIVAWRGSSIAFFVNFVCAIGLLFVVIGWRRPPRTVAVSTGMRTALGDGVRYAFRDRHIQSILVRTFGFSFCGSAIWALMPLVARDLLGGGPVDFGILFGCFGAGSLIAALSGTWLRATLSLERLAALSSLSFMAAALAVAANLSMSCSAAAMVFAGASWVTAGSTFSIAVQTHSPRSMAGRAVAAFQMMFYCGVALGSWCWGHLAVAAGIQTALAVSATALLFSLALRLRWALS